MDQLIGTGSRPGMSRAPRCSYHLPASHVVALIALFALVPAALGEAFFDLVIRRDLPYGTLLWIAIGCWNVYWFLLRFAHVVDVEDGMLRWRAPLRSGSLPISELRSVRPSRLFSNIEIMETADGTRLLVWAVRGFSGLMEAVASERPDLPVLLSLQGRLAERIPVRSSFRVGTG
jgi:hypothetical protein